MIVILGPDSQVYVKVWSNNLHQQCNLIKNTHNLIRSAVYKSLWKSLKLININKSKFISLLCTSALMKTVSESKAWQISIDEIFINLKDGWNNTRVIRRVSMRE